MLSFDVTDTGAVMQVDALIEMSQVDEVSSHYARLQFSIRVKHYNKNLNENQRKRQKFFI
jgi:hypothetical protein